MTRFVLSKLKSDADPDRFILGDQYLSIGHRGFDHDILCLPRNWKKVVAKAEAEFFYFGPEAQKSLQSCHRFCRAPLVLAAEDVQARYRCPDAREEFSCEGLMDDFFAATKFYLELQMKQPYILVQILGDTHDSELPEGTWVWCLGYYSRERSIWDKPVALIINIHGCRDIIDPELLNITHGELKERFPETPDYWISADPPPRGFRPPSLAETVG